MRQASWEELFRQGEDKKPPPSWLLRLKILSWEDLITLGIVFLAFFTVTASINSADWVPEMPSLFTAGIFGLVLGLLLAKIGAGEILAHLIAISAGVVTVTISASSRLGGGLEERISELFQRMDLWQQAVLGGGISNDDLPFVVLVVCASYITAYWSAWSIFRWYNPWLALVPGGLALLTNISYLPGQNSVPLLIYLFCAILLVSRVNVLRQARDWQRQRTGYPDLISLHVLNVTVWVALFLLATAWIMPVGSGSGWLFTFWQKITAPVAAPLNDLGRVFSAIDSKKGGSVHQFGSTLPLQGSISLGGGEVMQVTATEPGFLRAQSYDFYTAQGWKVGPEIQISSGSWPATKELHSIEELRRQQRRAVSIQVKTSKKSGIIVSAGQPLAINVDSKVVFGPDPSDVASLRPTAILDDGSQYRVDSSVSNASEARLRSSTGPYPPWITPYLQLPPNLPRRIAGQARTVTAQATTPYDRAVAIEQYLRTFAIDTAIDPAPPNRDSVEYFLFEQRRGYFDYHASAMVVMLRSLGIPARMTVGYTLRNANKEADTNTYIVSESNAFAWPEVYFPGLGWIEFNPTPSEPPVIRAGTDAIDGLTGQLEDEFLFDPNAGGEVEPASESLDSFAIQEESGLVGRIVTAIVLGFLAISAISIGAFQYGWQRGLGGVAYPVQVWEKTLRLARWSRVQPLPQETPREVMKRLHRVLPEVNDLDFMAEAYLRSRYGRKELSETEQQRLVVIWREVRSTLLRRVLRIK